MRVQHLLIFGAVLVVSWLLALYLWPRALLSVFKRAILAKGFGDGPVPVNSLYVQPQALFTDPLGSASGAKLAVTGVNRDTLLSAGWLDLRKGPQLLHVPDAAGRYYSVQFTDPSTNLNFAYVGTRTTGTQAGEYLVTGPNWAGQVPRGTTQISSPNKEVLVIGRILVYADSDLPAAHDFATQMTLTSPPVPADNSDPTA